jgi:alkaline phosphatase D
MSAMAMTRRSFLRSAGSVAVAGAIPALPLGCRTAPRAETIPPFLHGVASGDPTPSGALLWTRVTAVPGASARTRVRWEVATDPAMAHIVARGTRDTSAASDHVVKVEVATLEPGRSYYYRFDALGEASPVGRTRTLPVGHVDRLRFAVCSCSNYPAGYFGAYAAIAARADLAAVLHLGDYIYEHGVGRGSALGRDVVPAHEIVTLDDYRKRYALYRGDPDLQELHRQHPMIAIWDDHEFADNAWLGGAKNHQPESEGSWALRSRAARQAYFEWMPVRPYKGAGGVERALRFGDLADLVMLDTRGSRDAQADAFDDHATMADPQRSLLGERQHRWLEAQLEESAARRTAWRVLGQQVMMGVLALPGARANVDAWDGYRSSRARLLEHIERRAIPDVVVLSGDVHSSWAMDLASDPYDERRYDPSTGRGAHAVEFVAPAISSGTLGSSSQLRALYVDADRERPHLRYFDLDERGYALLDIDHVRVQAEWHYQHSVERRDAGEWFASAVATARGESHLVSVGSPSASAGDVAEPAPAYSGLPTPPQP